VVSRHLVEDSRDLDVLEGRDQAQERLVVELAKDVARAILRQEAEGRDLLRLRQALHGLGDVGRVAVLEHAQVARVGAAPHEGLHGLLKTGLAVHPCRSSHTVAPIRTSR
jgi:hypothetical protein